jgi:uncharacterized protein
MSNSSLDRINVVDALRGFALSGIVIIHMVEMYLANSLPEELLATLLQEPLDTVTDGFVYWTISGKFFSLFSLLFGLSFFIQMDRAAKKGADFKLRFLWRLILLAGFGFLHRLFYPGDILIIYAFIGVVLIPFYHLNNRMVFSVGILLFLGIGRYFAFALWGNDPIISFLNNDRALCFSAMENGSFVDVALASFNRLPGDINSQLAPVMGRAYLTLGYFLMGMLLGKSRWLENIGNHLKTLRIIMITSLIFYIASIFIHIELLGGSWSVFDHEYTDWPSMFTLTFFDLHCLFFTLFLATGFTLLFEQKWATKTLNILSPYGRMALTNYVMQSMIGSFIFFNWGLGLLGHLRALEIFGLAIFVLILQVALSHLWLKHFKFGPLEWLWRSLTYFKIQPIKKKT